MRTDGRMPNEMRPLTLTRNYTCHAPGSVLVEAGATKVLCTAMVEDRVPPHCLATNMGWVTAEYCMLPSATPVRRSLQGHVNGRVYEIQRLIGRALRAAVDLNALQGRTIWIDCNVIQADGGTRTASITGGFVALLDALNSLKEKEAIKCVPLLQGVAAISVGVVEGTPMLDLCAEEDQRASVDMNVVMTHDGRFIELQGTAERQPFTPDEQARMVELARAGIDEVRAVQVGVLAGGLKL